MLCVCCNRKKPVSAFYQRHRRRCKACDKVRSKAWRDALREEFLGEYGGECTCCGETEEAFLTLEHLLGDGAAHKRQISKSGYVKSSSKILSDLKKRGWPKKEYTILCMNCNTAKWKLGRCPHKKSYRAASAT